MTSVNDLIKTECKCSVPIIISTEKYEELCRKAGAIEDIKAEIDQYLYDEGFGEAYRNDVMHIIDKHLKGESNDG